MKTTTQNIRKSNKWAALTLACALMMAALAPATAQNPYPPYDFSQANSDGDTLYYRITSNTNPFTVAVTRCQDTSFYNLQVPTMTYEEQLPGFMHPLYDYDTMLVIPSSVIHNNITYSVSSIDEKAFLYEKGIRRVELPSSVIIIQSNAFVRSSLQEIAMPNVQTIGYNSFGSTQLTHINLPSTFSSLGENAFSHSLLEEVEVPSGVSMIPNGCFYGCPLRSITLHEGLQTIGDNAFTCYFMDSLTLPSTLQ